MGTYHSNIPEYMHHYAGIGWLKPVLHGFFRHQYNFLQALYVPTPFIHKYLRTTQQMDKATKLGVWGRGIDLDRFTPKHRSQSFRAQYGFTDRDVVLTWVGRLVPEKRPDIFCYVVRRLAEEGIPFRALVVGAGPCEEEVKALPNTVFAGWLNGDDLAVAYASSDIFLFPSAVETFGNVTLEAAASGLPIVVENGCSGHLVNHGVNGFACRDGDLEAYYSSTLCLVLDDMRRKSMSEEGRKFSLQFEKRLVCRRMIENYSTVTDEFYTLYGGHHANRDEEYSGKEGSFRGGNNPRPLFLRAVEAVFIVIFVVMYHLASSFFYMRERMLSGVGISEPTAPSHPGTPTKKKTIPSPSSTNRTNTESTTSPLLRMTTLDSIVEAVEELSEDGSHDSVSSIQHHKQQSKLHASPAKTVTTGLSIMQGHDDVDDDTQSTTSVSESDEVSSASSGKSLCYRSDLPISHILAIGFVKLMELECRLECRVHKCFSYVTSPSKWNLKRKRKNSSDFLLDDTFVLDLQRKESKDRSIDGCDLSDTADDVPVLMSSMNARDERLNMRRGNSSQIFIDTTI